MAGGNRWGYYHAVTFAYPIDIASTVPPWLVRVFAVAWGFLWGSFVNVVIHRVPRELSVVRPASRCPACGAPVAPIDNIPVLSWLLLRGRARCCGARISARYMVVELLGGMLALAVFEATVRPLSSGSSGSSGPNGVPWAHAVSVFAANFALSMALVAAAFIDAEHMYLPDAVTLGGTLFGIATPALRAMSFRDALVGALVGFLVVWLPLIVGYKALRGRAGMGLGDAKLVMLAGAWFGWPGALFALFAGAIQATLGAAVLLLAHGKIDEPESVKKDREELHRAAAAGDQDAVRALEEDPLAAAPASGLMAARLPFGPFLCVAIVEWMLAGWWIQERWFS